MRPPLRYRLTLPRDCVDLDFDSAPKYALYGCARGEYARKEAAIDGVETTEVVNV